jgi:hypothetical protein|tara:strand:- start:597 stop:833 length:237 start_codon:yes stop_codon:yes gene_type:complete
MANFKDVNKAIRVLTGLDIEAVRGDGYVWFEGVHGFDKINSVYAHPVTTPTGEMARLCLEAIYEVYSERFGIKGKTNV